MNQGNLPGKYLEFEECSNPWLEFPDTSPTSLIKPEIILQILLQKNLQIIPLKIDDNSTVYSGTLVNKIRHGQGILSRISKDGVLRKIYSGLFQCDAIHNQESRIHDNFGFLQFKGPVFFGLKHGYGTSYDFKGNISKRGIYKFNLENDKNFEIFLNNRLLFKGEMKNGKKNGYGCIYFQNGNTQYKGHWWENYQHGEYTQFRTRDNILKSVYGYERGLRLGVSMSYHITGKLKEIGFSKLQRILLKDESKNSSIPEIILKELIERVLYVVSNDDITCFTGVAYAEDGSILKYVFNEQECHKHKDEAEFGIKFNHLRRDNSYNWDYS